MVAQRQRMPGLDAWRAALMLGGLLLHASILQDSRPLFVGVEFMSAHFRMGVFMVISGLLTGMITAERDVGRWLGKRTICLGLPTLTGLLLTGPTVSYMATTYGFSGAPVPPPLAFHHLWFMLALLLYLPLVPAYDRLDRRFLALDQRLGLNGSARRLQMHVLGLTSLASAVLMGATYFASRRWGPLPLPAAEFAPLIAGYAPMYLLGLGLGRAPRTLTVLLSDVRAPAAALVAVLLLELTILRLTGWTSADTEGAAIKVIGMAICPVLAAAVALRSALTIRSIGPRVRRLADASLTMYLVHFPLLMVLNIGFARMAWNVHVEYAIAVTVGGILSYTFHQHVVRRSPVLLFLLNGQFDADRAKRDGAAPIANSLRS